MKIGIIGAGWYGLYLALSLKERGYGVEVYEKESDILTNVSGKFGIRLHAGPHYPRSKQTRESCLQGLEEFRRRFPDLVVDHEYSIYGLGSEPDANNEPSHVNYAEFKSVCEEPKSSEKIKYCEEINPEARGFRNLKGAWNIDEPSIVLGNRLREKFKEYLKKADINVKCNYEVKELKNCNDNKISITNDGQAFEEFDYVINATGYQAFLPDETQLPFKMDVYYQPLLALVYQDKKTTERPFSLIVMDGLYPCMMPYIDCDESSDGYLRKYILTHAKWTTAASCKSLEEAKEFLQTKIDDNFIETIKRLCETEIIKFWPEFAERFNYIDWQGTVLAKAKSNKEFRAAVTYADKSKHIIHVLPGKISNIFNVEKEVADLLTNQNIISCGDYQYISGGILHQALPELNEKSNEDGRNTCSQQTYIELLRTKTNSGTIKIPLLFKPLLLASETNDEEIEENISKLNLQKVLPENVQPQFFND